MKTQKENKWPELDEYFNFTNNYKPPPDVKEALVQKSRQQYLNQKRLMNTVVVDKTVANLVRTEGKHNQMISRNISSSSNHNKKPKLKHFELRHKRTTKTRTNSQHSVFSQANSRFSTMKPSKSTTMKPQLNSNQAQDRNGSSVVSALEVVRNSRESETKNSDSIQRGVTNSEQNSTNLDPNSRVVYYQQLPMSQHVFEDSQSGAYYFKSNKDYPSLVSKPNIILSPSNYIFADNKKLSIPGGREDKLVSPSDHETHKVRIDSLKDSQMQDMLASQRNQIEDQRREQGFMPVHQVEQENERRHYMSQHQESSPNKTHDETQLREEIVQHLMQLDSATMSPNNAQTTINPHLKVAKNIPILGEIHDSSYNQSKHGSQSVGPSVEEEEMRIVPINNQNLQKMNNSIDSKLRGDSGLPPILGDASQAKVHPAHLRNGQDQGRQSQRTPSNLNQAKNGADEDYDRILQTAFILDSNQRNKGDPYGQQNLTLSSNKDSLSPTINKHSADRRTRQVTDCGTGIQMASAEISNLSEIQRGSSPELSRSPLLKTASKQVLVAEIHVQKLQKIGQFLRDQKPNQVNSSYKLDKNGYQYVPDGANSLCTTPIFLKEALQIKKMSPQKLTIQQMVAQQQKKVRVTEPNLFAVPKHQPSDPLPFGDRIMPRSASQYLNRLTEKIRQNSRENIQKQKKGGASSDNMSTTGVSMTRKQKQLMSIQEQVHDYIKSEIRKGNIDPANRDISEFLNMTTESAIHGSVHIPCSPQIEDQNYQQNYHAGENIKILNIQDGIRDGYVEPGSSACPAHHLQSAQQLRTSSKKGRRSEQSLRQNNGSPTINNQFISIQNFETLKGGQEQVVDKAGEDTDHQNSIEMQKSELHLQQPQGPNTNPLTTPLSLRNDYCQDNYVGVPPNASSIPEMHNVRLKKQLNDGAQSTSVYNLIRRPQMLQQNEGVHGRNQALHYGTVQHGRIRPKTGFVTGGARKPSKRVVDRPMTSKLSSQLYGRNTFKSGTDLSMAVITRVQSKLRANPGSQKSHLDEFNTINFENTATHTSNQFSQRSKTFADAAAQKLRAKSAYSSKLKKRTIVILPNKTTLGSQLNIQETSQGIIAQEEELSEEKNVKVVAWSKNMTGQSPDNRNNRQTLDLAPQIASRAFLKNDTQSGELHEQEPNSAGARTLNPTLHAYGVRGDIREPIMKDNIANNAESAKSIGRYQKYTYSEKNQDCPVIPTATIDGQNQSQKSQIQLGKSPGHSMKSSPIGGHGQRQQMSKGTLKASRASNHVYSPHDSIKKGQIQSESGSKEELGQSFNLNPRKIKEDNPMATYESHETFNVRKSKEKVAGGKQIEKKFYHVKSTEFITKEEMEVHERIINDRDNKRQFKSTYKMGPTQASKESKRAVMRSKDSKQPKTKTSSKQYEIFMKSGASAVQSPQNRAVCVSMSDIPKGVDGMSKTMMIEKQESRFPEKATLSFHGRLPEPSTALLKYLELDKGDSHAQNKLEIQTFDTRNQPMIFHNKNSLSQKEAHIKIHQPMTGKNSTMSCMETLPPSGLHKVSKSNSSNQFNHTGISQMRLNDDKSAIATVHGATNVQQSNSHIEVVIQEDIHSKKNQSVQRSMTFTDQNQSHDHNISMMAQEAHNVDLHSPKITQIQKAHSREMKKKEFMSRNCKNINPRSIQRVITKSILNQQRLEQRRENNLRRNQTVQLVGQNPRGNRRIKTSMKQKATILVAQKPIYQAQNIQIHGNTMKSYISKNTNETSLARKSSQTHVNVDILELIKNHPINEGAAFQTMPNSKGPNIKMSGRMFQTILKSDFRFSPKQKTENERNYQSVQGPTTETKQNNLNNQTLQESPAPNSKNYDQTSVHQTPMQIYQNRPIFGNNTDMEAR